MQKMTRQAAHGTLELEEPLGSNKVYDLLVQVRDFQLR